MKIKKYLISLWRDKYKAIKIFSCGASIDIFYVIWLKAVASGSAFLAGLAAMSLAAPSIFGYMSMLEDKKLVGPYLLGLFTGTFLATLLFSRA